MSRQIRSYLFVSILVVLTVSSSLSYAAFQEAQPKKGQGEEKSFQVAGDWVNSSGTSGQRFSLHSVQRLQPYLPGMQNNPDAEVEEEEVRVDEHTIRRVTRLYRRDGSGPRRLARVVEETRTTRDDGREEAVRKVSSPDANGRLRVDVEEKQNVTVRGQDEFEIQTIVSMPGVTNRLEPVEHFVQVESRQPDGTVHVDKTRYVVDGNGDWTASERRIAVSTRKGQHVESEEEVFTPDANNELSLSAVISTTESTSDGSVERTTETHALNPQGQFELKERVRISQSTDTGGKVKTVQDLERLDPGSGKMKIFERIVASEPPPDQPQGSTEIRVEVPDASGRLSPYRTYTQQSTQDKGDGSKHIERSSRSGRR